MSSVRFSSFSCICCKVFDTSSIQLSWFFKASWMSPMSSLAGGRGDQPLGCTSDPQIFRCSGILPLLGNRSAHQEFYFMVSWSKRILGLSLQVVSVDKPVREQKGLDNTKNGWWILKLTTSSMVWARNCWPPKRISLWLPRFWLGESPSLWLKISCSPVFMGWISWS
jgi:hypothetical protein